MFGTVKKTSSITMRAKGVMLTFCWCLNLAYGKPQHQESVNFFWKNTKPGELLRSLDAITSNTQDLTQAVQMEGVNIKNVFPKKGENSFRFKKRIDKRQAGRSEEEIPYDYDRAYEEFVKKYFEDSMTNAFSGSDSTEYMQYAGENSSGQEMVYDEEHEPVREGSKISVKLEKCKNIVRDQQNCLICKNSKNGESSEICSYKKEIKPNVYQFEKKNNYRKYRTTPKQSKNENSSQQFPSTKPTASIKKHVKAHKIVK